MRFGFCCHFVHDYFLSIKVLAAHTGGIGEYYYIIRNLMQGGG
jgi:hypothetical protein